MDIIDVMLAKALTPQGQINTYASKVAQAAKKANEAVSTATTAVDTIEQITGETQSNNEKALETVAAAEAALQTANEAAAKVDAAIAELAQTDTNIAAVDSEIDKLKLSISPSATNASITNRLQVTYPSGKVNTVNNVVKMYQQTGQNTDGTMTQKAITAAIDNVDNSITSIITRVEKIEKNGGGTSGGGSTNLGEDNAGIIVVIGEDGNITAGDTTEIEIIEALIKAGAYQAKNAVGLELDYENKTFTRTQEAANYEMGSDFTKYAMFGGRRRCTVDDSGKITAFYGDANYKEDGSMGQVMVYQPKFYYQRVPMKLANARLGKIIRKESIILSAQKQSGFKLHPLFVAADDSELDYVFLSAYEGSAYDTLTNTYDLIDAAHNFENAKLSSIAGAKPISGKNQDLTIAAAEQLATNRGTGWHIMNMAAESANQILQMVEYGTPNAQTALESGLSSIPTNASANCASITGSTSTLGSTTGAAEKTTNETNGTYTEYDIVGRRAVSYRGFENPYGNIWRMIGGTSLSGDGALNGGVPYICKSFNYNPTELTEDYESVGFCIPQANNWISGFGYGNVDYDWVFMPAEATSAANSALPIGDSIWTTPNLDDVHMLLCGGAWAFEEGNGLFYYGCDKRGDAAARSFSARLMYIPQKNNIYTANYNAWLAKVGG